jgi:hypothetical protein
MPENTTPAEDIEEQPAAMSLADFLETIAPNELRAISNLASYEFFPDSGAVTRLCTPDLQLHCPNDTCNGTRFFRCVTEKKPVLSDTHFAYFYVRYFCSNCQKTEKTFSIAAKVDPERSASGEAYKLGESPPFGPPTPTRLIKLIGPDREEFLKGRRCENQGLGVGAFIYYRRVVENQKGRILTEIAKVAEKVGAAEHPKTLENAIEETQFSRALSMAKDAIPQSLLINGHNPLGLLHRALSEGVHGRSDEECLEIAGSVRIVLAELSERLAQALKDEAELSKALSRLMSRSRDG